MSIKFVIPLQGVMLENPQDLVSFNEYNITSNATLLHEWFGTDAFMMEVGRTLYHKILHSPCFYGELEETEGLSDKISSEASTILQTLWFVKECSAYGVYCFIFNTRTKEVNFNSRNFFISSYDGIYKQTHISTNDFITAFSYVEKLSTLHKPHEDDFKERTTMTGVSRSTVGTFSFAPYNSFNRVLRAWYFLSAARSTSILPQKIGFYVAVLECLFTTDNESVSYKIQELVSIYLGGELSVRLATFDQIKVAYGVRSNYFHGGTLDNKSNTREKLIGISRGMDDLIRTVLTKVLIEDSELFLQPNDDLRISFRKMILG